MDFIVVDYHIEPSLARCRLLVLEEAEPIAEQRVGFACTEAVMQCPGGQVESAGQVMLCVLARRHDRHLAPFGHPGTPHCGQQMDIQFVRKNHRLRGLELLKYLPDARQTGYALRVVVFGDQLGTLPDPADLVEPAPPRLGGDRDAALGLQR
jgi:hypothetical protein